MALDYSYVSVELTTGIEKELIALLMSIGIPPAPKHDFHITVVWDPRKGDVTEPLAVLDPEREWTAHVVSIDVLGDGLVFHLSSKELMEEHKRLLAAGYQHSFPDFLPHMSVAYDLDNYHVLMVKSELATWVGRPLTFTQETFALEKL